MYWFIKARKFLLLFEEKVAAGGRSKFPLRNLFPSPDDGRGADFKANYEMPPKKKLPRLAARATPSILKGNFCATRSSSLNS